MLEPSACVFACAGSRFTFGKNGKPLALKPSNNYTLARARVCLRAGASALHGHVPLLVQGAEKLHEHPGPRRRGHAGRRGLGAARRLHSVRKDSLE